MTENVIDRTPRNARRAAGTLIAALAVGLLAAPQSAFAHADLESANPAPNSVIGTPVTQVVLTFSEPVTLVQPGITVDNGSTKIATTPTLNDKTVTAVLATPIGGGTYDVTWNVRAADGHEGTGSYSFSIAAGVTAPPATSAPVTTAVGAPTTATSNELIQPRDASSSTRPATTTAPAKESTGTARNWLVYVIVAAGILIAALVIGGIVRLVRKRR